MTLHLDVPQLVAWAAGDTAATGREHLDHCPTCAAEVGRLRSRMQLLCAAAEPEAVTTECLDDVDVAALAAGDADAELRGRSVDHAAGCRRCAAALADGARALGDDTVAREIERLERPRRHSWLRLAVPLAGAAAAVLLLRSPATSPDAVHRSTPVTEFPAAALVYPRGPVADVPALRWNAVPMADRYRVTLFAEDGTVIHESVVSETFAVIPGSVRLESGRTYFWTVAARTGFDRWVTSEMAEFSVLGEARP
jgi:hypothetical protein